MCKRTIQTITFIAGVMVVLTVMGLLWASFPTTHVSAGFTPTPDSPPPPGGGDGDTDDGDDEDDGDDDDPCRQGAILGRVTDLCFGQPAAGAMVEINDIQVNTDGDGRYSLTGLSPATFDMSIWVPGEWQPSKLTVSIDQCGQHINVDLTYNSCPPPPPTPAAVPDQLLPPSGANWHTVSWPPRAMMIAGLWLVAGGFFVRWRVYFQK